jgi:hypothetical protein
MASFMLEPLTDEFVASYARWREAAKDVREAYYRWTACGHAQRALGFLAYCAALDREEQTAAVHAEHTARLAGGLRMI